MLNCDNGIRQNRRRSASSVAVASIPSRPAGKAIRERSLAQISSLDGIGQIAEINPDVASGRTRPILTPDLMEFFRKFPFVQDAVGVQVRP